MGVGQLLTRWTRAAWVLGCLGLSAGAVHSQPASAPTLDPARLVSQLGVETWGGEDGLPQSRVEALTQSLDGHVWVGTQEGLARFDGVAFTVVGRGADGLPNTDVRALAPARDGGVWVGTRRGGLAHVDPHLRVRLYGADAGLLALAVTALAPARDGGVWVGTREGLCRLPADGGACRSVPGALPDPYVRALLLDPAGTLWVGTRGGLARVRSGRAEAVTELGGPAALPINALALDPEAGLWLGAAGGLGYLQDGRLQTRPEAAALEGTEVDALLLDDTGSLWAGTVGAGLLRLRGDRAETLLSADGADLTSVIALLRDAEGGLWVGTGGSGLARLRTTKFTPYTVREGLPSDRVYTLAADRSGGVWAGTTAGLARISKGRVVRTVTAADGLLGDDISVVYATRDGTVWAGVVGEGVCRVRDSAVVGCLVPGAGVPDPYATALVQASDGTLWLGTDAGLSRWDGSAFRPSALPATQGAPVTALAEGPDGTLWVGTYGAGLLRVDGPTARPVAGTEADNVLTIHTRANGDVWVGTDGSGLIYLPSGADALRLTAAAGLPSDIVPQILEDEDGGLWMTSNRGVFTAPSGAFEAAARGRARLAPTLYTRGDGLPRTEANGGSQPAGARAPDGTLYFPTAGGVAAVHPARIAVNPRPPAVVVHRMTVDGDDVRLGGGAVRIPPGRSEFAFSYAGLSFTSAGDVRHRYRLDGRDTRWTEAGARREAYYTDLPPGDYVFRVQAANADGVWSDTDATAAFTLRPHVWQTGWFAALCVVLTLGAAFGAYKGRTAQLRARQRQLEATVAERTAELASEKAETERLNSELSAFNATLQQRVREQLEQIVRGSRLQKYFPRKVVDRILNQEGDVEVAAERRRITIVFTDLAGFTRLSETTPPDRVTALLNEYLNEMVALIDAHGGTLDKVMGDGIMVLFGAADDMSPAHQARHALAMAAKMQAAMGRLAARWKADGVGQEVSLRIGVHQADVTVGNFGTDDLVEFTAIGRGVNLAARLEAACPVGGVLASEAVVAMVDGVALGAPLDLSLKGIEGTVRAFPLELNAGPKRVAPVAGVTGA